MSHSDAEYVWLIVLFFGIVGFLTPYIQLEFGGTVATFEIDDFTDASFFAVLNTITSILFWTFGVPPLVNILIFIPIRALMWFILYKASPIGKGG